MVRLTLAPEGQKYLFAFLLLSTALYHIVGMQTLWVSIPLAFIVVLWFLENRPVLKSGPLSILAPATGMITTTSRVNDPWLNRDSLCVNIRLTTSNSLYSFTEGKLKETWGRKTDGIHQCALWIQTDEKDDIVMEIGSRLPLKNQLCVYPKTGDRIGQGDKIGFLYLPGYVAVYMPTSSKHEIEAGHNKVAGQTIAELAQPANIRRSILNPVEEQ